MHIQSGAQVDEASKNVERFSGIIEEEKHRRALSTQELKLLL